MIAKPLTFSVRNIWPSLSELPLGTIHLERPQVGGGGGLRFHWNLQRESSKKLPTVWGGGVKNCVKFADVLNGWSLAVLFHCCQLMAGGKAGVNYFYFYLQFPTRKTQGLWPKSRFFRYLWVESVKKIIIFRAQSFSSFVCRKNIHIRWVGSKFLKECVLIQVGARKWASFKSKSLKVVRFAIAEVGP